MARFNFIKIVVRDLAAMEQFYIAGLGFAVQNRIDAEDFSEVMLAQKEGQPAPFQQGFYPRHTPPEFGI